MVHFEHVDFQKRFLRYSSSPVYRAARKNRGWSVLEGSEFSRVDWEHDMFQGFSHFQDHRILSHHSRIVLCLVVPELEP